MTDGKEIGGILKDLTKSLTGLNGYMNSLKDGLTGDISKEELMKVNKQIEDLNPKAKVDELRNKFNNITKTR